MLQWPSDAVWQARQGTGCLCQSRSIPPSSGQKTSSTCRKVTGCTQARPDVVSREVSISEWTPLTECHLKYWHGRLKSKMKCWSVVGFDKGKIKRWFSGVTLSDLKCAFHSPATGRVQKVLRLFVVLIDIPVGMISPRLPYIWQGFYSLMIRVNMAQCLHFYRRAGRNNTIAKIQPIWEKNNKKQHLTAQNALHPREQPQLLLHVQRGEL